MTAAPAVVEDRHALARRLSMERTAKGRTRLPPKLSEYIHHIPTVRQQAALLINCHELLFGGAAGGGKSDFLLMAALQYCDLPDYAAVIFRRNYPQLKQPGGLIPRAMEWLEGTRAEGAEKMDGYYLRWDFPPPPNFPRSSSAVLKFDHMQNDMDYENKQGGEYQSVGVDELGQFFKVQVLYMFSRLRRKVGVRIPLRLRSTANPGGVGHDWVKERYGIPDVPVTTLHTGPEGRVFLPSKIRDNPHIDQKEYEATLSYLDPVTRARLLQGDWSVREDGGFFKREWFDIVNPQDVPAIGNWTRAWDLAATAKSRINTDPDYSVGARVGSKMVNGTRHWWVSNIVRFRKDPGETRLVVKQIADLDGRNTKIHIPQDPGQAGKDQVLTLRQALGGYAVVSHPVTGSKAVRAAAYASSAKAGCVHLINGPWVTSFLEEHELFTGTKDGPHDDQVDATADGYMQTTRSMGWAGLNEDPEEENAA